MSCVSANAKQRLEGVRRILEGLEVCRRKVERSRRIVVSERSRNIEESKEIGVNIEASRRRIEECRDRIGGSS